MKQTSNFGRVFVATLLMGALLLWPQTVLRAAAPGVPMIEATTADVTAGTKGEPYYITPRRLSAAMPSTNLTLSGLLSLSSTSGTSAGGLRLRDVPIFASAAGAVKVDLSAGTGSFTVPVQSGVSNMYFGITGTADGSNPGLNAKSSNTNRGFIGSLGNAPIDFGASNGSYYFTVSNSGGVTFSPTQTTTGITDLLINPTTKASGNLIDAQVNSVSKFKVDYAGIATATGGFDAVGSSYYTNGGAYFLASSLLADGKFRGNAGMAFRNYADSADAAITAGAATFSGLVVVGGSTPASAAASGTAGTVTWDSSYIYICTATNTWKRVAIATW